MRARIAVGAVLAAAVGLSTPAAASARYSAFGNRTLGDCDFASVANLVQARFPGARITTQQVVNAWRDANVSSGLDYLETTGFDGHRIASYVQVSTRAEFIAGANAGGLQASILAGAHAVAVVRAGNSGVEFVNDGRLEFDTWSQWRSDEKGLPLNAAAVTWAPADTKALEFVGSYETSTMTDQVEPTGTQAPIEALGMVNLGYTFDGWSLRPDGSGPLLQSGEMWNFNHGAVLYAVWTYTG